MVCFKESMFCFQFMFAGRFWNMLLLVRILCSTVAEKRDLVLITYDVTATSRNVNTPRLIRTIKLLFAEITVVIFQNFCTSRSLESCEVMRTFVNIFIQHALDIVRPNHEHFVCLINGWVILGVQRNEELRRSKTFLDCSITVAKIFFTIKYRSR